MNEPILSVYVSVYARELDIFKRRLISSGCCWNEHRSGKHV